MTSVADAEITTTLITQLGILLGIVVTGIFSVLASVRAKRTERTSAKAAEDSAVVRAETRNAHNPNQPLRHDLDQVLANQQNFQRSQEDFQQLMLEKLETYDRDIQGIRKDGVVQWEAINAALAASSAAVRASSVTVKAAKRAVTEVVKVAKE